MPNGFGCRNDFSKVVTLIALGPAVAVQVAFPFCEWHPHAELGALDAGDRDNAGVEGVTVETVDREDEDRAVFIQTGEVDLSASRECGGGGRHQSRSRVRRAGGIWSRSGRRIRRQKIGPLHAQVARIAPE